MINPEIVRQCRDLLVRMGHSMDAIAHPDGGEARTLAAVTLTFNSNLGDDQASAVVAHLAAHGG